MNTGSRSFFPLLLALIAGALSVFAFAPFGYWPIQIASLALLFYLCQRENRVRRIALIGWIYGFAWCACGVYWLYISMHRYGGMPSWIAALAVIVMGMALGLFAAFATGGAAWLRQHWRTSDKVMLLLILPSLWSFCEWMRGWVFTGFPWVVSGYAYNESPLAAYAPLIGVYGIGWCAALLAACLVALLHRRMQFRMGAITIAAALVLGGFALKSVNWTEPVGQPISVQLLQGNVSQEMKFSEQQTEDALTLYHDMIAAHPADLIATPETAIPIFSTQLPRDYMPSLRKLAQKSGSHLMIGIPIYDGSKSYTNSVIGITPADAFLDHPPYRYDKHHLVPFGEFVPTGFRWFVNLMRIPLGDFSRGNPVQPPFAVKDQWVLPNICYEDLFGEEIAEEIAVSFYEGKPQPTILLNLSNIAWFGDTIALPQHLQISQMRAMETGRPMLRSTNTGATAAIDPRGNISAMLAPYTRGMLPVSVQGYGGTTPYILYGNMPIVTLSFLLLFIAWLASRRSRRALDWS